MKRTNLIFILLSLTSICSAQTNSFVLDSSKFNKKIVKALDTIYSDDQGDRLKLNGFKSNKTSRDSLWKIIREKDRKNLVKMTFILDKYGWLGPQDAGMNGSQALFLVIQHADLATQEKYLPVIKNAVKEGKTLSSNLAILEDRIAVRKKKKQIYGSQPFTDKATGKMYIYPIIDPDHVDERRKTMGMPPMVDYCKYFNIKWDLEEYKSMLPEIEKAANAEHND
jgi:hypothetical protein